MENKHRFKLCFRDFANGRALGGHMRSHMMKLYAEEKASKQEAEEQEEDEQSLDDLQSVHSYSSTSSPSSSSSEEEDEEFEEESEEVKELSVLLQDRESETESSKKKKKGSICRRSKRVNSFNRYANLRVKRLKSSINHEHSSLGEAEPTSSISDTTPEEHVAHCLMMLSRDKWEKEEREHQDDHKKFSDDRSEDSGVVKAMKSDNKVKGKYRCEECHKLFRSYQALGGHRASHNKIRVNAAPSQAAEEKIHQCPFCHRIFSSGQALGGHKRSHFIGGGAISTSVTAVKKESRITEALNIDLNLPAPIDEDETSQIAVSAVSDAEFL